MQSGIDDRQSTRLRDACNRIISEQPFRRSPTLAKLLHYLVEKTLAGEAERLKAFTIATEGLGRQGEKDGIENYARVLVGRLRKALAAYAEANPDQDCLTLEPGHYAVSLVSCSAAVPLPRNAKGEGEKELPAGDLPLPFASRLQRPSSYWLGFVLLVAVVAGAFVSWKHQVSKEQRWKSTNFPTVSVTANVQLADDAKPLSERLLEQDMLAALSRYAGLRAGTGDSGDTDYTLRVDLVDDGSSTLARFALFDVSQERLIWSQDVEGLQIDEDQIDRALEDTAFTISGTSGVLTTYARRRGYGTDSPYGCWLRFTERVEQASSAADEGFKNCTSQWYEQSPTHPLAAMLYGWSLTDQSIMQASEAGRREMLDEAIAVLDQAWVLNQESAPLRLAAMRAHSFNGDVQEVREAGEDALALNPESPDIRATVGMTYVFWGIPEGEQLLLAAMQSNPSPPVWYHVGLAVSAMMRDEPADAKDHLDALDELGVNQPMLQVLLAAYDARIGDTEPARERLQMVTGRRGFFRVPPELVLQRLPVAPRVRRRLEEWLEPVL